MGPSFPLTECQKQRMGLGESQREDTSQHCVWKAHWLFFLKKYRNGKRELQERKQNGVRLKKSLSLLLGPIRAPLAMVFWGTTEWKFQFGMAFERYPN